MAFVETVQSSTYSIRKVSLVQNGKTEDTEIQPTKYFIFRSTSRVCVLNSLKRMGLGRSGDRIDHISIRKDG